MDPDKGWLERWNASIRGIITLMFAATFCYMGVKEMVDAGIFSNVLSSVVAFWFAAKAAERMVQQALNPVTPPGTVETKTVETKTVNPALGGNDVPKP